jgi:hypothetical protein
MFHESIWKGSARSNIFTCTVCAVHREVQALHGQAPRSSRSHHHGGYEFAKKGSVGITSVRDELLLIDKVQNPLYSNLTMYSGGKVTTLVQSYFVLQTNAVSWKFFFSIFDTLVSFLFTFVVAATWHRPRYVFIEPVRWRSKFYTNVLKTVEMGP